MRIISTFSLICFLFPVTCQGSICSRKVGEIVRDLTKWVLNDYTHNSPFSMCKFDDMIADCVEAVFGVNSVCIPKYIPKSALTWLPKCSALIFDHDIHSILDFAKKHSLVDEIGKAENYASRQGFDTRTFCNNLVEYFKQRMEAAEGGHLDHETFFNHYCRKSSGRRMCRLVDDFLHHRKKYLQFMARDYLINRREFTDENAYSKLIDEYILHVAKDSLDFRRRLKLSDCVHDLLNAASTALH